MSDYPDWPVGDDGMPEQAKFLYFARNSMDYEIKASLLRAYGIPARGQSPLREQFTTVLFGGELNGEELYVPQSRLEEAAALLGGEIPDIEGGNENGEIS